MSNRINLNQSTKTNKKFNSAQLITISTNPKKIRDKKQKADTLIVGASIVDKLAHKLNRHTERNFSVGVLF